MKIIQKLQTIPFVTKFLLNHYAPYRGAGIQIESIELKKYAIRVKMPLTRQNRNIVGVHFGGSLYSMVDPFYMLLLMHHLGPRYIVWDKAADITFLAPGRGTVYAHIQLSAGEISKIKDLAEDHAPIHRQYSLNIVDDAGTRIAEVKKTLYIRLKKTKALT
jgi:acyl-coenzyme A thioesterase PaaI-like protein